MQRERAKYSRNSPHGEMEVPQHQSLL